MEEIRILIADDHQIFRDGIKSLLKDSKEVKVVAEANDGKEVMENIATQPVDVILMDIQMPELNGIEATRNIEKKLPDVKILVLSMFDDEGHILDVLEAGASGYILKNTDKTELLSAIKTVAAGGSYFGKEVSDKILLQMKNTRRRRCKKKYHDTPLTEREVEILRLIAEGLTNQEIASKLFISTHTVDTHRRNLHRKLNAHNTATLIKFAYKHELLG